MTAPTSIKDTRVKRFSPAGTSDSLDATDEFPGACSALTNLVPDLSTKNVWTVRPASTKLLDFTACPNLISGHSPGQAFVWKVIGSIVYGLFTDLTSSTDFPFAYNLATNAWIHVTGSGFNPASLGTGGEWIPPTIDLVGVLLVITHPSFASPNFFGVINISAPTSPTWNTGDLTSGGAITFTSLGSGPPDWVCQFNQRAYFGLNRGVTQPSVIATDDLALKVTNASQVLTFGDNLPLTAAAPLPLSNQLGGIIQALMVFKGTSNIYQITGDFALTNITINTLNVATGTLAPRAICRTPVGLAFLSPAGLRIIDQNATVSDPIGSGGKGVIIPIINGGVTPSRACAGCDGVTLRVSVATASSFIEYWFNLVRKVWSGPHTWSSTLIDVWNGNFLAAPSPAFDFNIYNSPTDPNSSSTYTELSPLTFTMQSAVLEDNAQMAASELSEMQLVASAASSNTMTVTLVDPNGATINSSSIVVNSTGLFPYRVDFPAQSVFNRAAISITGSSAAGVRIGDTWMRLKTLGYIPPPPNPPSS